MPTDDLDQRVRATTEVLLVAIAQREIEMTADQRVGEAAAACLVGLAPGSLKNARSEGRGPEKFYRLTVGGSRVSYRVQDIARWIEVSCEDW